MSVKSEHPERPSEVWVSGVCDTHPDIRLLWSPFQKRSPAILERGSSDAVVRIS